MENQGLLLKSSVLHLDNDSRIEALQELTFLGLHRYFELTGELNINEKILHALFVKSAVAFDTLLDKKKANTYSTNPNKIILKAETPLDNNSIKSIKKNISRPDATDHYPFADSYGTVFDVLQDKTESNYLVMGAPAQRRFATKIFDEFRFEKKGLKIRDIPEALRSIGLPVTSALVKACSVPDANSNINDGDGSSQGQQAVTDVNKHIKLNEWLNLLNRYTRPNMSNIAKNAARGGVNVAAVSLAAAKHMGNHREEDEDCKHCGVTSGVVSGIGRYIDEPPVQSLAQKSILKVRNTHTSKIRKVQSRIGNQVRRDKLAWEKSNPKNDENANSNRLNIVANKRRVDHFIASNFLLEENIGKGSVAKKSALSNSNNNNNNNNNNDNNYNINKISSSILSSPYNADASGTSEDLHAMKIAHKFLKSEVGRLFGAGDFSDRFEPTTKYASSASSSSIFDESSTISEINLLSSRNYQNNSSSGPTPSRAPSLNQLDKNHPSIALKAVKIQQPSDKNTGMVRAVAESSKTRTDSAQNNYKDGNSGQISNDNTEVNDMMFNYRTKSTRNGWSADFGRPNSVFVKRNNATTIDASSSSSSFNNSSTSDMSTGKDDRGKSRENFRLLVESGKDGNFDNGIGDGKRRDAPPSRIANGDAKVGGAARVIVVDLDDTNETEVSSSSLQNFQSDTSNNSAEFMETVKNSLALRNVV